MKKYILKIVTVLLPILLIVSTFSEVNINAAPKINIYPPNDPGTGQYPPNDPDTEEYEYLEPDDITYEDINLDDYETVPLDTLEDEIEDIDDYDDEPIIYFDTDSEAPDKDPGIEYAEKNNNPPYGGAIGVGPKTRMKKSGTTREVETFKGNGKKVYETIKNGNMANKYHPTTKILFNNNSFPVFPGRKFTVTSRYWKSSTSTVWNQIKGEVKKTVTSDYNFSRLFTQKQINQIKNGKIPDDFRLHHHENSGTFQLVHKNLHDKTGHTGGKSIWGSNW
ncbi:MAG TPA: HNH endonuclease [Niallia sp.]|nr:HNH endonuclease [Niallia sp.]